MTNGKYYGKYQGTVLNNLDPDMRGRLSLTVPDVTSLLPQTWAEASIPLAGPTGTPMGFFIVPPIGAGVWVEFENGDPNHPIWVGCRWGTTAEQPSSAKMGLPVSPSMVLQTLGQNSITISDLPGPTGGITIKSLTGAYIIVNDTGIYIDNAKGASLTMVGPTVTVNKGALTII